MKFVSLLDETIEFDCQASPQKCIETIQPPKLNQANCGVLKIPPELAEISWSRAKDNPTEIVVRHLLSQTIHCQQTLLSTFVFLDGLRRYHTYEVSLRSIGPNGQVSPWISYLIEVI